MSLFPSQIITAVIMVIDNTLCFTKVEYRFRSRAVAFLNKLVRSIFIQPSLNENWFFFVLRREKPKDFPHTFRISMGCHRGVRREERVGLVFPFPRDGGQG